MIRKNIIFYQGLPQWLSSKKKYACNAGDTGGVGSMPGWGGSSGERNGNPLQYSCLGNPWTEEPGELQSTGSKESDMTEHQQHTHKHTHTHYVKRGLSHVLHSTFCQCPDNYTAVKSAVEKS